MLGESVGNVEEASMAEKPDTLQDCFAAAKLNSLSVMTAERFDDPDDIEEPLFKLEEVGEFYRRRESHDRSSGCEWCREFFKQQSRRGDVARPPLPSVRAAIDLHALDRVFYGLRDVVMNLGRSKHRRRKLMVTR
jgi:hypothetical protein